MSELGAGTRGSSLAFPAMLTASLKLKSDLFDKYPVEEIENENHYLFNPPTNYFAKHIETYTFFVYGPLAWALGTLGPTFVYGPLAWALGTLGPY